MAPDLSSLTLDTFAVVSIAPQDDTKNMSEESLFVVDQMVGTIYELNGSGVNISPVVPGFFSIQKSRELSSNPSIKGAPSRSKV